ncbi:MAG TPA: hypothetical protein VM616_09635, partial [Gammaproteobacteria bacterium]|nr:hypothetical protein [Gammaproteobacteria bacterium]
MSKDSFRLFDAAHKVSDAKCIVDSSKNAFRFRSLWRERPEQVKAIVLCRDYRAVTYSMMRRGKSLGV